jgi:DNA-binding LacI/PurR family transcriptional regulator
MHQPIHDIGERLGDMLLNTITNGAGKQNSVILDAELVVRGSTLKAARQ